MKNKITYTLFSLFILYACTQPKEKETQENKTDSITSVSANKDSLISAHVGFDYKNTTLKTAFTDSAFAKFSSLTDEDRFVVAIPEGPIKETNTVVRVTKKNGEIVYEHTFWTRDLINGYEIDVIKSDEEMARYILKKAKTILGEGITDPNKLADESYLKVASKEDFTNYDAFNEIKNNNRMLLLYTLNEETHFYLGFSNKENKTVTIIECC